MRQEAKAKRLGPVMQQVVNFVDKSGDGVRAAQVATELDIDKGKAAVYLKRAHESGFIDRIDRGVYGPKVLSTSSVSVYEVYEVGGRSNTSNRLTLPIGDTLQRGEVVA